MLRCDICDSKDIVSDIADTDHYTYEGDLYYIDTIVYTCQECGNSWEEVLEYMA